MRTLRRVNVEHRPYLFNSMTNIKNLDSSLSSISSII